MVVSRPLSKRALTVPSSASITYMRPSMDTAISFPSFEKVTPEMGRGLVASWSTCKKQAGIELIGIWKEDLNRLESYYRGVPFHQTAQSISHTCRLCGPGTATPRQFSKWPIATEGVKADTDQPTWQLAASWMAHHEGAKGAGLVVLGVIKPNYAMVACCSKDESLRRHQATAERRSHQHPPKQESSVLPQPCDQASFAAFSLLTILYTWQNAHLIEDVLALAES